MNQRKLKRYLLLLILVFPAVYYAKAQNGTWKPTISTPLGPATWGTPDQPWGRRRPVTDSDRKLIAAYRSAKKLALYYSTFTADSSISSQWTIQTDDEPGLKSCREIANVMATKQGLVLKTLMASNCHNHYSTGAMISKFKQEYGFFEASFKIADISGMNNAFWLTTDDKFEIDIVESHYPNDVHITLHNNNIKYTLPHDIGFDVKFKENLSQGFHDFGVLWTPKELIFEVDGRPVAVLNTNGALKGAAVVRFSTALADFAGKIPQNPINHDMIVRQLKILRL